MATIRCVDCGKSFSDLHGGNIRCPVCWITHYENRTRSNAKAYYEANKEDCLKRMKLYYQEHREELDAKRKEYWEEHKERRREICRNYWNKNKELLNAKARERRAKKRAEKEALKELERIKQATIEAIANAPIILDED